MKEKILKLIDEMKKESDNLKDTLSGCPEGNNYFARKEGKLEQILSDIRRLEKILNEGSNAI